jgi:hypothetical protein
MKSGKMFEGYVVEVVEDEIFGETRKWRNS